MKPFPHIVIFSVCMFMAFFLSFKTQASLVAQGTRIVHVTNLNDSGAGSLRAALTSCRNCLIVFEVGGRIDLKKRIRMEQPGVIVAGETAPAPGILLYGQGLDIRASDITLSHIAVYAGKTQAGQKPDEKDAISIFGSSKNKAPLDNIVLRHVTAVWGVDENVSVQGRVDHVQIERSLIAQGLRKGGHPKGSHSMNLLLGSKVKQADIRGNVLAASEQRSPRLVSGNTVSVLNNIIAMPGASATHLDTGQTIYQAGAIDLIGNLYLVGADTYCKRGAIHIDDGFFERTPQTDVYVADTLIDNTLKPDCYPAPSQQAAFSKAPLNSAQGWDVQPASSLMTTTLPYAGSFPAQRNPVDQALIDHIRSGDLQLIDTEDDMGGMPDIAARRHALDIPNNLSVISNAQEQALIKGWLCEKNKLASGLPATCS